MNSMLRQALRAQRELRTQLDNMWLGDESDIVEAQLKRFVTKRPCWTKPNPKARIFTLNPEPFNPAEFIGKDWSIWKGPKNGNGFEGEEMQDARSLTLSEVDMNSVRFENMLNEEDGETSIKGEEKIIRLKSAKFARLDARLGRDLLAEPGHTTLKWLYKERGITWLDLPGTIMRDPDGGRYVLFLCRDAGDWRWYVFWLKGDWGRGSPSAVLVL